MSYLDSPLYQQMLARTLAQGQPQSQYPGQALGNTLAQLLNTWQMKKSVDAQDAKAKAGNEALASLLAPENYSGPATGGGPSQTFALSGGGSVDMATPSIPSDVNADKRAKIAQLLTSGVLTPDAVAPQVLQGLGLGAPQKPVSLGATDRLVDPTTGKEIVGAQAQYGETPQYDQSGKAFVLDKSGNIKYLDGVQARPKIDVSNGQAYDPYNTAPGTTFAPQPEAPMSPERLAQEKQLAAQKAADAAANLSPFGRGMTGKAYSILAQGAKDPAVRGSTEYLTAWQILSNPHVDPNTGTVVVPDMSAFAPPTGMAANGQPGQQRMPSIQGFAPPNPSQPEAASAGYANRLAESSKLIDQNEGALTSLSERTKAAIPAVGNYLVSPEFQKGDQAERNFINAQLRRESGAAIAESEFANARKQYIPQPGDSKEVLAQKKAAREMAVQNMQLSAGNVLLPPGVIQQASPPRGAPMVPQNQGFGQPISVQRSAAPAGVDQKTWDHMTPEEKSLWR